MTRSVHPWPSTLLHTGSLVKVSDGPLKSGVVSRQIELSSPIGKRSKIFPQWSMAAKDIFRPVRLEFPGFVVALVLSF